MNRSVCSEGAEHSAENYDSSSRQERDDEGHCENVEIRLPVSQSANRKKCNDRSVVRERIETTASKCGDAMK